MFDDILDYSPATIDRDDVVKKIYKHYEDSNNDRFSNRIGGSIIGSKCDRKIFYSFRWVNKPKFCGRKLRLFDTGHLEEQRVINDFNNIGVSIDSSQEVFNGGFTHLVGRVDGIIDNHAILEIKTMSKKWYNELLKKGLKVGFYHYYAQCQYYMELSGYHRCLFIAKNKDTDDLRCLEVVYDSRVAKGLIDKALHITEMKFPPVKTKDFKECLMCDFKKICKEGGDPEKNCRSCKYSVADDAGFKCTLGKKLELCPDWEYIG